tara:strand:- start:25 stop:288 length:264 start_codon:yes stop_codon:yes gene_type:complete
MKKMSDYCIVIDTTGLRCPLPVLKVRKSLPTLKKENLALVISDDPLAEIDLRHYCSINGYEIKNVSSKKSDEKQFYEIMHFNSKRNV